MMFASAAVAATVAAAGLALAAGAGARADAPAASAGRVMRVIYVVRRTPDPPPPVAAPLMPTLPPETASATLDPGLESVQAMQAIRVAEIERLREDRAFEAATRRAYAAADDTLALLPRWPEPAAVEPAGEPAPEPPTPSASR